jgi:beta-phosphoglucomutase-like phosphatase (HAD superfamily)
MNTLPISWLQSFSALLFDFDGTLFDSMPTHNQAWIETFQKYNCTITSTELQAMAGIPNEETARILCAKYNIQAEPKKIAESKVKRAKELLLDTKPFPELENLVRYFYKKLPLGIVSGSTHEHIDNSLKSHQLDSFFSVIISCEDTERGKPFPDPFLAAAKHLMVNSEKCLVFEDGDLGIKAAHSAKMQTVKVIDGKCEWPLSI